jgi:hypothetical protein
VEEPLAESFYRTSLLVVGLTTLALFLLVVEGGFTIGQWRRRPEHEAEGHIGTVLGGLLGLLGLLLAFTFNMAGARYDLRRLMLLEQANAIHTAYLRADLLSEGQRLEARSLLRRYLDDQLEVFPTGNTTEAIRASQPVLTKLWSIAAEAATEKPTVIVGLFVQSINTLMDAQAKRVTLGWRNPLPPTIFGTLYLVALLALGVMGFEVGYLGKRRQTAAIVLALILAAVVLVIADLDRPFEGLLRTEPQPLLDLRDELMRAP